MSVSRTSVDADLFDSVQEAIDFVASSGGGVVYLEPGRIIYSELMGAIRTGGIKLPPTVTVEMKREEVGKSP